MEALFHIVVVRQPWFLPSLNIEKPIFTLYDNITGIFCKLQVTSFKLKMPFIYSCTITSDGNILAVLCVILYTILQNAVQYIWYLETRVSPLEFKTQLQGFGKKKSLDAQREFVKMGPRQSLRG